MFEVVTTGLALTWLVYRLVRLLVLPTDISGIGLDLPPMPQVCIDAIGSDGVVMHWEVSGGDQYYVVLVDGLEVAAVAGKSQCRLRNVPRDRRVCVEVVAVNGVSGFRTKSMPVYIQPAGAVEGVPSVAGPLVGAVADEKKPKKCERKEKGPDRKDRDAKAGSDAKKREKKPEPEPEPASSPSELHRVLERYQCELTKVTDEYTSYQEHAEHEEHQLHAQLAELKQEYDEKHSFKAQKDREIKELERTKNELSFGQSKLKQRVASVQHELTMGEIRVAEARAQLEKLQKVHDHQSAHEPVESAKITDAAARARASIEEWELKLAETGARIKEARDSRQAAVEQTTAIRQALDGGDIVRIAHAAELGDQADQVTADEEKWRRVYRQEVKKYVAIFQSLELARASRDPGYHPQKITDYQASCDFGDPLPKKKYQKGLSPEGYGSGKRVASYDEVYGQNAGYDASFSYDANSSGVFDTSGTGYDPVAPMASAQFDPVGQRYDPNSSFDPNTSFEPKSFEPKFEPNQFEPKQYEPKFEPQFEPKSSFEPTQFEPVASGPSPFAPSMSAVPSGSSSYLEPQRSAPISVSNHTRFESVDGLSSLGLAPSVVSPVGSQFSGYDWVYGQDGTPLMAQQSSLASAEVLQAINSRPRSPIAQIPIGTAGVRSASGPTGVRSASGTISSVHEAMKLSPALAQPIPDSLDSIQLDQDLLARPYPQPSASIRSLVGQSVAASGQNPPQFQINDYNSLLYSYSSPRLPGTPLSPSHSVSSTPVPQQPHLWNDSAVNTGSTNIWASEEQRTASHSRNFSVNSGWKHDIRSDFAPFGKEEKEDL
ncbi:hypothetical protein DICA2_A08394 [Diutina catenulata]